MFSPANDAEQFFEKMEERNSDTYDALMVGLYKVYANLSSMVFVIVLFDPQYKSYDRMFGLYDTMREEGLKRKLVVLQLE